MDPEFWKSILESVMSTGSVGVLMMAAVWWLNKSNGSLLVELKAERANRYQLLENEVQSCKADRMELHKQVAILKDQIIEIYRSRDARLSKHNASDE